MSGGPRVFPDSCSAGRPLWSDGGSVSELLTEPHQQRTVLCDLRLDRTDTARPQIASS